MKNLVSSVKQAVKVPLNLHWSVLILPMLLLFYNGAMGIPLFILLFGSLLVHEYAHVWMGIRQGYYVPYVITHGFGAAAMINMTEVDNFKKNFKIAIIGPTASLALAVIGFALHYVFHSIWTFYFFYINVILGIFNMLPIFPSDGGRVLYSILGSKLGGLKAVRIVAWVSWILCGFGILLGLYIGSWWLAVILSFLIVMCVQEKKVTEARLKGYEINFQ
jgi:Zn-dependent protease